MNNPNVMNGPVGPPTTAMEHFNSSQNELVEKLDKAYFEDGFNAVGHLMQSLPSDVTDEYLIGEISEKDCIQDIIQARLSEQVMANYNSFVEGLSHIRQMEDDLTQTEILCKGGRRKLAVASDDLVKSSFNVIGATRKKKRLLKVHDLVLSFQNLFEEENRMNDLLERGRFVEAVDVYASIQTTLQPMPGYKCLEELRERMKEGKNLIEEKILTQLCVMAHSFDPAILASVVKVYFTMGEVRHIDDVIKQAYLDVIDRVCNSTVVQFVAMDGNGGDITTQDTSNLSRMRFRDLCTHLNRDSFPDCYQLVLERLSRILFSYYKVGDALKEMCQEKEEGEEEGEEEVEEKEKQSVGDGQGAESKEAAGKQSEVQSPRRSPHLSINTKKTGGSRIGEYIHYGKELVPTYEDYQRNMKAVWSRMQTHVSNLISPAILTTATIQLEEFLHILFLTNQFVIIGENLCDGKAYALRSSMQLKGKEYVENFHKESFEYLKLTLENDQWQPLPVMSRFSFMDVKELRHVQRRPSLSLQLESTTTDDESSNKVFVDFKNGVNLFKSEKEDLLKFLPKTPSTDSSDDEKVQTLQSPELSLGPSSPPVLTSTSLNVLRYIGKYVQIMQTISAYALNSLHGLAELLDAYLYTVFNHFGPNAAAFYDHKFEAGPYSALRGSMNTIREKIETNQFGQFQLSTQSSDSQPVFMTDYEKMVPPPPATPVKQESKFQSFKSRFARSKSTMIFAAASSAPQLVTCKLDLQSETNLYGVKERIVATESIEFIVRTVKYLEHRIALLLPKGEQYRAAKFLNYMTSVCDQLVQYMRRNLPVLMVNMEPIASLASSMNWSIHSTISTSHSPYVDKLLAALSDADALIKDGGTLPPHIMREIWKEVAVYVLEKLLAGYALIKKCTTEGRALMSVDMNELKSGMESIMDLQPIPKWDHVNAWVLAFYIPTEKDFLSWIGENPGYTLAEYQGVAVQGLGAGMKKKERNAFLEEIEKTFKALS